MTSPKILLYYFPCSSFWPFVPPWRYERKVSVSQNERRQRVKVVCSLPSHLLPYFKDETVSSFYNSSRYENNCCFKVGVSFSSLSLLVPGVNLPEWWIFRYHPLESVAKLGSSSKKADENLNLESFIPKFRRICFPSLICLTCVGNKFSSRKHLG